jgi:hypothetical protein
MNIKAITVALANVSLWWMDDGTDDRFGAEGALPK